jgi:hypothetical protein
MAYNPAIPRIKTAKRLALNAGNQQHRPGRRTLLARAPRSAPPQPWLSTFATPCRCARVANDGGAVLVVGACRALPLRTRGQRWWRRLGRRRLPRSAGAVHMASGDTADLAADVCRSVSAHMASGSATDLAADICRALSLCAYGQRRRHSLGRRHRRRPPHLAGACALPPPPT